jgi:F/Y-rich N-terminus
VRCRSQTRCAVCAVAAVLSLGKVEFVHPGFHSEKHIWPVGYAAQRVAATPASAMQSAPHLCEILENPDGSGPLFR